MNLYLNDAEAAFVRDAAEKLGSTQAYVVRLLLRDFLDLPVGGSGRSDLRYMAEIANGHVQNLTGAR